MINLIKCSPRCVKRTVVASITHIILQMPSEDSKLKSEESTAVSMTAGA